MNSKRRAELQRKLTLNAVPRPPAGLAERIKADIPKYLVAETAPQRFTRTLAFPMRIAASIIVLAGAVIVAMMVTRAPQEKMASTAAERPVIFPPASRDMAPPTDTAATMTVARTEEVQLDIVQESPVAIPQIASARVAPPALVPPPLDPNAFNEEADRDVESGVEGQSSFGVVGGVVGGVAGGRADDTAVAAAEPEQAAEPQRMAQYAPEVPAPPPVAAPAPAPVAAAPPVAQPTEAFADAARLERRQDRATVSKLAGEARKRQDEQTDVFGISVNPQVFHDIRATLESGQRPAASTVNVEALVNYFAGGPARRPREVHLEVEVSPAALPAEGDNVVLRFTVDTPAGSGNIATDARVDVVINDAVVARAQRIGDAEPLARASALPYGTSVTGLYALELKPGLRSSQVIATVRLHYTLNGKPKVLPKTLHGDDLARSWQRSSRRHRLASLGALWAESLKGTAGGGVDVAKRAEELATQNPGDVRARELARAASASADGGR